MIVIYTPKVTNRIKYTIDFVFRQYFGIDYQLTENPDFTIVPENLNISYSTKKIENCLHIYQDGLLLETAVKEQKLFVSREAEIPVFFQTTDRYDIRFDIFSCIFFLLSRYEEYCLHEQDMHGRYKSSNSVLAKKEFAFSPIVETWLSFLKDELLKIDPNLPFKKYEFEYLPTFDVDNAFKYVGRNWKKHIPDISKPEAWKTLAGKQPDKFDIFDNIFAALKKHDLKALFFFLLNDEGNNNSNVSPDAKIYRELVVKIANRYDIGLHPSYAAEKDQLIEKEKTLLENIASKKITNSRQHFLKLSFPETYRALIKSGIQRDFSLAYPDVTGFRAGFSRAFYFFDIERNEQTDLLIQPSCWMDATYNYYQTKKFNEIQDEFLTVFNQLLKNNGKLVAIFHNDLLANEICWGFFSFINQFISESRG